RTTLPAALPVPDAGIPAALIARRPDVQAAWQRLESADWAAAAARADRLPHFTLSGAYGSTAAGLSGLMQAWAATFAAAVAAPVFDGGQRRAEESRQRAVAEERFHAYRETVLSALKEVEDALTVNYYQEQR